MKVKVKVKIRGPIDIQELIPCWSDRGSGSREGNGLK